MPKISELVEQRNKAVADARSIHERYTAAAEFRALSDEDKAVVNKALADASSIDELIEALQAVEQAETTASKDDSEDDSGDPGMDESKRSAGLSQRGLRNRQRVSRSRSGRRTQITMKIRARESSPRPNIARSMASGSDTARSTGTWRNIVM